VSVDLNALWNVITNDVGRVLERNPPYEDRPRLSADDLPDAGAETWFRVEGIVAVFVDLQGSTNLSVGRHPASTAAIYRAAMKNAVRILHEFGADFIQVQGDGAFGLFWDERAVERGVCAAITVTTFSAQSFELQLQRKWPDAPATGFKAGVAKGRALVKKIGTPRNPAEQEPIWAGKPVNYAAKAAQQATRGEVIVTSSVWDAIADNDYLTLGCNHDEDKQDPYANPVGELWEPLEIAKLDDGEPERAGHLLRSHWCYKCGATFVSAILAGKTVRAGWDVQNSHLYRWVAAGADQDELDERYGDRLERLVRLGLLKPPPEDV
jgi:class 3 adenylate cyclase